MAAPAGKREHGANERREASGQSESASTEHVISEH
jgi:hypothetical protein